MHAVFFAAVILLLVAIAVEVYGQRNATALRQEASLVRRNFSPASVKGQQSLNPATLHFSLIGSKNNLVKVLIIHGFGARGDLWGKSIAPLLVRKDCQVLVFDNRGVGLSSRHSTYALGRYTTQLMAQDALELLKIVGWQDAHLIGHSMGGMTAMELALAAPEAVRSLALVATCAQVRAQIPLRWAAFQEKLPNEFYNGLFIPALVGFA